MKKKIKWILVISWLIFIFVMSTDLGSSKNTSNILESILSTLNLFNFNYIPAANRLELLNNVNFVIRKSAHVGEYLILALLLVFLVAEYYKKNKKLVFIVLSLCFIYASFDEIHQLFTVNRTGNTKDIVYDFSGAAFGTILCFVAYEKGIKSFALLKNKKPVLEIDIENEEYETFFPLPLRENIIPKINIRKNVLLTENKIPRYNISGTEEPNYYVLKENLLSRVDLKEFETEVTPELKEITITKIDEEDNNITLRESKIPQIKIK